MDSKKKPIGLTLPIRGGNNGYFEQTYDSFTQKRMNVINLLRTRIGERRMQPLFGTRLWSVLLEPNTEILPDVITNLITEDITRWIDGISIKKVMVHVPKSNESLGHQDIYTLLVTVSFEDVATQRSDTVEIMLDSSKI